ncbi:MAG: hypothetical protein P4L83_00325 [Nevskia sp.]|nr:hypothetical protein [Nevskia sp.]
MYSEAPWQPFLDLLLSIRAFFRALPGETGALVCNRITSMDCSGDVTKTMLGIVVWLAIAGACFGAIVVKRRQPPGPL